MLLAERNRRRDASGQEDEAREKLIAELDEMAERMRAASGQLQAAPSSARRRLNGGVLLAHSAAFRRPRPCSLFEQIENDRGLSTDPALSASADHNSRMRLECPPVDEHTRC